jgi:hypothetical protein
VNQLGLFFCTWVAGLVVLVNGSEPTRAAAPGASPERAASRPCQLHIKGEAIVSLTLIRQQGGMGVSGKKFSRPGQVLHLPAGRYYVEEVKLPRGIEFAPDFGQERPSFELTPEEPYELVVGAPLFPTVDVRRHGQFLEMDFSLRDAAGRRYHQRAVSQGTERLARPDFRILHEDQLLDSGTFEYG